MLVVCHACGLNQLAEFDNYIGPHGSSWIELLLTDHLDSFSVESYPFAINHVAVIAFGNLKMPPPVKPKWVIRQYHHTDWDGLRKFLWATMEEIFKRSLT